MFISASRYFSDGTVDLQSYYVTVHFNFPMSAYDTKCQLFRSASCCPILSSRSSVLNEPPHDKTNKMAFAPSKDSDQPGHPPSLISLRCPHEER